MLPACLQASSFAAYPDQARTLAIANLQILRTMPLSVLPVLLRSLMEYDWKLPPERREIEDQLHFLSSISALQRTNLLSGFEKIALSQSLSEVDWVDRPAAFIEAMTASLWSSGQMESYRIAADNYAGALEVAYPPPPPSQARLAIVILGAGASSNTRALFTKLRPHGLFLTCLDPANGLSTIRKHMQDRAGSNSDREASLRHWCIDGGQSSSESTLTSVSYVDLQRPRELLLARIEKEISTSTTGPEQLRSLLASLTPESIGLVSENAPGSSQHVLDRFRLSLLTEGAGTQIFATTFVQWAARECIRRAQPETLLVRYLPRQRAQDMNMMLTGSASPSLDPEGSFVDANMGAYYTWLSMRRLTGSDQMRFMTWFEDNGQAILIGPGLPQGTSSDTALTMSEALKLLVS